MDYRYGSHTVFQIEYHFVWVTKYRYKEASKSPERQRSCANENLPLSPSIR